MAEYPLLIFPQPGAAARAKRFGGGAPPRIPDHARQAERLAPQFQRLQEVLEQKRVELRDNTFGLIPEQVLVLETIGSINNFVNTVQAIPGLEWLGEFGLDSINPEHGFEDTNDPQRLLNGQLFLVMTDDLALQEMQRLFNSWQENPDTEFRQGYAGWKRAFAQLRTIRPWGAEDRIRETGVLDDWSFRLEHQQESIPFQAELWFRNDSGGRQKSESYIRSVIESMDGEVVQQCVIPEISYHAILGRLPPAQIREITQQPQTRQNVRLLQCDGIRLIHPVGQCAVRLPEDADAPAPEVDPAPLLSEETELQESPTESPLVALFDGLPLAGHQLLDRRIVIDDPDDYESAYQARERYHGTTMASLICHGDRNEKGDSVKRLLYARPIMKPQLNGEFTEERIPEDVIPIDLIHRAVRRLYEPENNQHPAAPSVRVINLSVCDLDRPFDREVSPWARLLDWLAWKYNVLFIVSAGNHTQDIQLEVEPADFDNIAPKQREEFIIKAVASDTRNRRLLSPAETLNGLTVGASHEDCSTTNARNTFDPFTAQGLPSVISAHGPGPRKTIKPDIFLPGGQQFLEQKLVTSQNVVLEVRGSHNPPGQCVAAPGSQGELNYTRHTRGTSNAAALASRSAMLLYEVIEQLRESAPGRLPTEYDAVLLKALLVHGADWANSLSLYESVLRNGNNSRGFKEYVGRFLGYGAANIRRVMFCTDQRATVLGVGELADNEGAEFIFPLPPSLARTTNKRRLAITLAYLTPVNSARQGYRVAHLWFNPSNRIAPDRQYADFRAVQRGTVQHEILEGRRAVPYQDGENITIKVNCRADAGNILEPIRYALAVTLEVAEGIDIPVYQEIRDRLAVRVQV